MARLPGRPAEAAEASFDSVAGNSLLVAVGTILSRVTGLGRLAMIAAVLGPTYLGNTFQATYVLPTLTYELVGGALFVSLLVPSFVRVLETRGLQAAERLACGFFGLVLVAFAAVTALVVLAGPAVLELLALGVGDTETAGAQRSVGWFLLLLMMPQVLLYAVAGTSAAVLNARGRFVLPAAAPALENVGVMLVLAAFVLFFRDATLLTIETPQILVLGLGTTGSVALHAGALWWGARRVGMRLVPTPGWRDGDVRALARRGVPSAGWAALESLRNFAILPVANRIPGGVVAFQFALSLYHLPVALAVKPVAVALLPRLSLLHHQGDRRVFRDEFVRGMAFAFFFSVPAALAYIVLSHPLARAVSFGEMASETAVTLVAASLAALALGILAETSYLISTHASYALHDARTPFDAMVRRTAVSLVGICAAFVIPAGTAVLVALGLAVAAGNFAGAWYLSSRLRERLPTGDVRLGPSLLRTLGAAALMCVPAYLAATQVGQLVGGRLGAAAAVGAAALAGTVTFVLLQRGLGSPELESLFAALGRARLALAGWRVKSRGWSSSVGTAHVLEERGGRPARSLLVFGLFAIMTLGSLAAVFPTVTLVAMAALVLAGSVGLHPPLAAYLLIGVSPLVVGVERGSSLGPVRLTEGLLLLVAAPLVARALFSASAGFRRLSLGRVEAALVALAVTGSAAPLLWLAARGRPLEPDDVLYSLVLWKYLALFLLVRAVVRTEAQVRACLWLSLSAGALVAVIGLLQSLEVAGISGFLLDWFAADDVAVEGRRAFSTIGSLHGMADLMVFNLAIVAGLFYRSDRHRRVLTGLAALLLVGMLATGSVSGVLALLVGAVAVGAVTGRVQKSVAALAALGALAAVAAKPVIDERLTDFSGGVPESWSVRWDNLATHFWPELASGANWLLGVRPAARLAAPEPWLDYIYIESGYTWLLWTGGIPFLLAFAYFLWVAIQQVSRVARSRSDAFGAAGLASVACLWIVGVLMLFDPHLTLRGGAELFFPLLALACAARAVPERALFRAKGGSPSSLPPRASP